MHAFPALAFACLALLSLAQAAPADNTTPTGGLAKRFQTSAEAAGGCYYTCPDLNGLPSDDTQEVGTQTYCSYSDPSVICRYRTSTGVLVGGIYQETSGTYNGCPATADSHGPCDSSTATKRSFARALTPLERTLKSRQWSGKKAAARAEKKGTVPWLKK